MDSTLLLVFAVVALLVIAAIIAVVVCSCRSAATDRPRENDLEEQPLPSGSGVEEQERSSTTSSTNMVNGEDDVGDEHRPDEFPLLASLGGPGGLLDPAILGNQPAKYMAYVVYDPPPPPKPKVLPKSSRFAALRAALRRPKLETIGEDSSLPGEDPTPLSERLSVDDLEDPGENFYTSENLQDAGEAGAGEASSAPSSSNNIGGEWNDADASSINTAANYTAHEFPSFGEMPEGRSFGSSMEAGSLAALAVV